MKNALKAAREIIAAAYDYTQFANHKIRFVGPKGVVVVTHFSTTRDAARVSIETDTESVVTNLKYSQIARAAELCRFDKQEVAYSL